MRSICKNKERGFTIIEMLVVVAIVGVIMSVGVLQYRSSVSQQQLTHATTELVTDIRNMQQMSANYENFFPPANTPVHYTYQLQLWDSTIAAAAGVTPNGYQLTDVDAGTTLSTVSFAADNVTVSIMTPVGHTATANYYSFDLDRTLNGVLINSPYQFRLTHNLTGAVMFVNVDSRVGRVWTNTNGAPPISL